MSDEEDLDDLPSISFNTSANNSSTFVMPSVEKLAEQRASVLECERKLGLLRQRAGSFERIELGPSDAEMDACESELALAAAVSARSVSAEQAPVERYAPAAAELWAALTPHLPPHAAALQSYLSAPASQLCAQLTGAVTAVGAALAAAPGALPDDELLCTAAMLSVAVLARESRCRRCAARALHTLLDDHASSDQVGVLADVLLKALPAVHARLLLSDALRSGADSGADLAAAAITGTAALELLHAPGADSAAALDALAHVAAAWRACDEGSRYVCVQLIGRLLAAHSPLPTAQLERLLALLALPARAGDVIGKFKTKTAVCKLKLLFGPPMSAVKLGYN